jgi:hypothetical protein
MIDSLFLGQAAEEELESEAEEWEGQGEMMDFPWALVVSTNLDTYIPTAFTRVFPAPCATLSGLTSNSPSAVGLTIVVVVVVVEKTTSGKCI